MPANPLGFEKGRNSSGAAGAVARLGNSVETKPGRVVGVFAVALFFRREHFRLKFYALFAKGFGRLHKSRLDEIGFRPTGTLVVDMPL